MAESFPYDMVVRRIDGSEDTLGGCRGRVLLVVNTASRCGFTPQYEKLEALYRRLHERGFDVLGFPCNQFMHQEPGDDAEIASFCSLNYDVSFPMFARIDVNGPDAHPLYRHLKAARPGLLGSQAIKWNFTKFLVDRTGRVTARYAPADDPERIGPAVERLLDA